eukprot:gene9590-17348_t
MSGVELKEQGNRLFAARQYEDAAACYSKAISQNPSAAIYYTNRALCFLKLQSWTKVVTDCQKAIELDPKSVKGYYFLGQAHLEQKNYDDSITNFKRAHDLARDQKLNFGDDIASEIRIAKKQRWSTFEEKRITQEIELQTYVNRLIQEDRERQISELSSDSKSEEEVEKITSIADERLCQLNELFAQVDDRRKRVGHFDPITRAELTSDRLIPNLAMKEVIDCFLEENGWAIDY